MEKDRERLDNTILEFCKVLEQYKDKKDIKEIYERIERLRMKRHIKNI